MKQIIFLFLGLLLGVHVSAQTQVDTSLPPQPAVVVTDTIVPDTLIAVVEEELVPLPVPDTLTLLFMGDVMGHDPQIESAYDPATRTYSYESVFAKIAPVIQSYDWAIANLEVTLAGPPYTGYPQFCSPVALALACKNSGIDALMTSNNHSCDKGKKGILRTLNALDSLEILHTGTFRNKAERDSANLLILDKHNIRLGILNYTYGTNELPTPPPTEVNRIDTALLARDIRLAQNDSLDKLIIFLHWGKEYESYPSKEQVKLAEFLYQKGADMVIGSHPHVIQRMEYHPATEESKERFTVYSMGNFVSNQRTRLRDGGVMASVTLVKDDKGTHIAANGYQLTWVNKPVVNGKTLFEILPAARVEDAGFEGMTKEYIDLMKIYLSDSRDLYGKDNVRVEEIK